MFVNSDLTKRIMVDDIYKVIEYYKKAIWIERKSRDIRYFMSFLIRLPQIDQHLFSLLYFRKQAVHSFNYTLKFPDEYIPTESEKKQLLEMKERFKRSKLHNLIDTVLNGRLMGMSAVDLTWGHDQVNKHFVEKMNSYDLTELDYDLEDDNRLLHLHTDTKSQKLEVKELNHDRTFEVRFNPMSGIENDYPGGFLRVNFLRTIIKYWDFFNWARDNEKSMIYAQYEERFKSMVNDIQDQLENISEDSTGVFPKGVDINVLDNLKSELLQSHESLEKSVNRGMSLSIAGQYTATDPSDGHSYASSKIGYSIAENVTLSDLIFVEKIMSDQYLLKDYQLNYSNEPRNAFPVFVFQKRKYDDLEARARIITDLLNTGVAITKDNVYSDLGLKVPDDDDEVVKISKVLLG